MTIRRKVEVADLEKVISKGGGVVSDVEIKSKWTNFTLRIKSEMLADIDKALKDIAGLSKTGFILQAIQEKLKKKEN